MPPRNASGRGAPRGGATTPTRAGRPGGAGRGSRPGPPAPPTSTQLLVGSSVQASTTSSNIFVHLKRPGFGKAGRQVTVTVNSFAAQIPDATIVHYDVVLPNKLPARFNLELFTKLQDSEPNIFTPKVVYDGRKNAYAPRELDLGGDSKKFTIGDPSPAAGSRPPKVYTITLNKVATINNELLHRFIAGSQQYDEKIDTAIMAHNVAIRMEPNLNHPFDKRSFYLSDDRRDIGGGLQLWRGIFQSVRPTIGRMVINVDLKAGVFYKAGRLIDLCMEFIGEDGHPAAALSATKMQPRRRHDLGKFLTGLQVLVATTGNKRRTIRGISDVNANALNFTLSTGAQTTVAQYFASLNRSLQLPGIICVQVGASAMIPLELCRVVEGQFARKQLSDQQMRGLQEFSTIKPMDRLRRIKEGLANLHHGTSDYVRQFGMDIASEPLQVSARILEPPKIIYKSNGKDQNVIPNAGTWQMGQGRQFYKPATIQRWAVIVYERQSNFSPDTLARMIQAFVESCKSVGIKITEPQPIYKYEPASGSVAQHLKALGAESVKKWGDVPSLVLVILPKVGGDIRSAIKYMCNTQLGVPSQCLKGNTCARATSSYWTNVMQKVNTRLGGVNSIATSSIFREYLHDKASPAIVMGADVIHPAPGAKDRPSFAAVVGAMDSDSAIYMERMSVQQGRRENIVDMQQMCKEILEDCMRYRRGVEKNGAPLKRILFYRDGVSEGQFDDVLNTELVSIRDACKELNINPKITLIIVGKRHHNQMFSPPKDDVTDRRSGNLMAGTVIDTGIAHPTDFDFILQSHGGQLGTSRPGHYSVIHDEFGFSADSLQALTNDLCYTYSRCTRSVSIPSPVYYADMVCSTAKLRYDPNDQINFSDTGSQISGGGTDTVYLETFKNGFKKIHHNLAQERCMHFV